MFESPSPSQYLESMAVRALASAPAFLSIIIIIPSYYSQRHADVRYETVSGLQRSGVDEAVDGAGPGPATPGSP